MSDAPWITEAKKYIGQKEIKGTKHNPFVLRLWSIIRAPFTDDETPWCAGFVGGMLEAVGIKSTRSAWARSYRNWGVDLLAPVPGCIVVFERGPTSGHVAFALGRDRFGSLLCLGGNQGDMVKISPFGRGRVLDYRWPAGIAVPKATLPVMTSDGKISTNEA